MTSIGIIGQSSKLMQRERGEKKKILAETKMRKLKKKKEEKKPNLPSLYNSFQVDSSDAILYNGQVH